MPTKSGVAASRPPTTMLRPVGDRVDALSMVILLVLLAACAWLAIAVFALALCAMAKRGDETVVDPGSDVGARTDGSAGPPHRTSAAF